MIKVFALKFVPRSFGDDSEISLIYVMYLKYHMFSLFCHGKCWISGKLTELTIFVDPQSKHNWHF